MTDEAEALDEGAGDEEAGVVDGALARSRESPPHAATITPTARVAAIRPVLTQRDTELFALGMRAGDATSRVAVDRGKIPQVRLDRTFQASPPIGGG